MCKGLTPNREAYARGVLFERKTKRQAYRDAYPGSVKSSDETIDTNIWYLENNTRFIQGFKKLQEEAQAACNITRDDILRELSTIGFSSPYDNRISVRDKISALQLMSKILGFEQSQKQAIDISMNQKPRVIIEGVDDGRGGYE